MITKILKAKIVKGKIKIIGSIKIDTIDLTLSKKILRIRNKEIKYLKKGIL